MFNRNQTGLGVSWILVIAVVVALSSVGAVAQESPGAGRMMPEEQIGEMPMERLLEPTPFYR